MGDYVYTAGKDGVPGPSGPPGLNGRTGSHGQKGTRGDIGLPGERGIRASFIVETLSYKISAKSLIIKLIKHTLLWF